MDEGAVDIEVDARRLRGKRLARNCMIGRAWTPFSFATENLELQSGAVSSDNGHAGRGITWGIGCPGLIDERGTIVKGGQNLPGNWEGESFNLPAALGKYLPRIGGHDVFIQIHNDAVVQGLSEVPNLKDVSHWGVMTIGTGLGNARFTNRTDE
jgi:hypothetical protein